MNELEDIKLKALLQNMELDKPASDFSARVMNAVFAGDSAFDKIKSQRILGKGFWIILILFVSILVIILVGSNAGFQSDGQISLLFSSFDNGVSDNCKSVFSKIGNLPISIAIILAASSLLLFVERIINSNSKLFAN